MPKPTALTKTPKTQREVVPVITTHEGMALTVTEVTNLQLEVAAAQGEIQTKTALAERLLADGLAPVQKRIEELGCKIKARASRVLGYVIEHRDELMPNPRKKSFDLPTATVGFAIAPKAKVVLLADEDSTDAALRIEGVKGFEKYIRIPLPELDKEAILADRDILTPAQLAFIGIRIEQPEKFYITPKSETAAAATTATA